MLGGLNHDSKELWRVGHDLATEQQLDASK